jgi:hypothetical protein
MKKLLLLTWFLAMQCFGLLHAEAAIHHVRAGATGSATGDDWTNAYPTLPSSLVRGDTYYIATGTYAGRTFNTPASGTALITIKGATNADHGTNTGWSASMSVSTADGGTQATFTSGLIFNTSYWVFDGVVGAVGSRKTTDYGFKMNPVNYAVRVFNLSSAITDVMISHISAVAPTGDVEKFFLSTDNSTKSVHKVTWSHNLLNGWSNAQWATSAGLAMNDWLAEYNIILNGYSSAANHGEDINNNYGYLDRFTIRYNIFEGRTSGTATIVGGLNGPVGTYYIYGNVFKNQVSGDGTIACVHENATMYVYNNTFINVTSGGSGPYMGGTASDCVLSGEIANNVLYSMSAGLGTATSGMTRQYNAYFSTTNTPSENNGYVTSGNPFVDHANGNFGLTSSVATTMPAGRTLSSPYNFDMFGKSRSGFWYRGAIQFESGSSLTPPPSPTNLSVQ